MSCDQLRLERQGCFRLYSAARLLIQAYQPWFSRLGITYTQYLVLMLLWEQDGRTVNSIAGRLHLESNTLTPLVKRLEAMKIVTRRKGREDARQTIVKLTERGRAMEAEAAGIPDCMTGLLVEKGVSLEDFARLMPVLDNLIEALSK